MKERRRRVGRLCVGEERIINEGTKRVKEDGSYVRDRKKRNREGGI